MKIVPSTLICIQNIRGTALKLGSVYIINYFASEEVPDMKTKIMIFTIFVPFPTFNAEELRNKSYFPFFQNYSFKSYDSSLFLFENRRLLEEKEMENTLMGLKGNEIYILQRYCQFC